jgi:hypothetical protein
MVLLDASAIARNVSRDLVFPASRRVENEHISGFEPHLQALGAKHFMCWLVADGYMKH